MEWDEEFMKTDLKQIVNIMYAAMNFGMCLKTQRETKLKSRKELAADVGISYATLAALENDQRFPDPQTLTKLLNALELDENDQAYLRHRAAEDKIRASVDRQNKYRSGKPHKQGTSTPLREEVHAMLTAINGEGWEERGPKDNNRNAPSRTHPFHAQLSGYPLRVAQGNACEPKPCFHTRYRRTLSSETQIYGRRTNQFMTQ